MEINNIQDYLAHLDELKDYEIVCRDGDWLLYPDDENGSAPTNDKLSRITMEAIKSMGGLRHIGYVVSHHSVQRYKAQKLDIDFDFLWEVITKMANKRFTSATKLIKEFSEYNIVVGEQYDGGSYWGGSTYCKTITFKRDNKRAVVTYYYLKDMLLKNKLFTQLVILYCKLMGKRHFNLRYIPWVNGKKSTVPFSEFYYKQLPNMWKDMTPDKLFNMMEDKIKEVEEQYKAA